MVMSLFAVFWLSFGPLQMPTLGLAAAYSATGNAADGAASKEYNAVVGLYLIVWGFALLTFFYLHLEDERCVCWDFWVRHACDVGAGWSLLQGWKWRL